MTACNPLPGRQRSRAVVDRWRQTAIVSGVREDLILRIDDRLVHGQVTAGWVQPLGIDRIVLVNDAVAADEFEREIYAAAVPKGVELTILPVGGAVPAIRELRARRTMCLVASAVDALRLLEAGLRVEVVNVGGIHGGPGRRRFLPFVSLSAQEEADCRAIVARGASLDARMLPGSDACDLADLLDRRAQGVEK
jgi:mannose/fructose/N-acetylgalactosamine-specific phosphotransferase system component IIB